MDNPKYPLNADEVAFLDATFTFHPVKDDQAQRYESIRAEARKLGQYIMENAPACAERTLALRKLQEAVMFANAAIAIHEA